MRPTFPPSRLNDFSLFKENNLFIISILKVFFVHRIEENPDASWGGLYCITSWHSLLLLYGINYRIHIILKFVL